MYTSNEIVFLFFFFGPFLFSLSKLNSIGTIRIHILRIQVYIEEMKDVFFFFFFLSFMLFNVFKKKEEKKEEIETNNCVCFFPKEEVRKGIERTKTYTREVISVWESVFNLV